MTDYDFTPDGVRAAYKEAAAAVRRLSNLELALEIEGYRGEGAYGAALAIALLDEATRRQRLSAHQRLEEEGERLRQRERER